MARTSIRERPDREEVLWPVQKLCPACGRAMRLRFPSSPRGGNLRAREVRMERKKASDFDPEVLRLFDQYVHGMIDRRGFLAGAGKYAADCHAAGISG